MCDIVLLSDDGYLQDAAHFARGVVPGDGVHTCCRVVMGLNRARYFLLTGQRMSPEQALACGAVNEVVPRDRLLARAWEHAGYLALRPPLTLRLTRSILVQDLQAGRGGRSAPRACSRSSTRCADFLSWRGGQEPLDRAWDDDPWGGGGPPR